MLEQHLTQAEGHITLGERHIARQRELVAELESGGHDTSEARRLLASFGEMQQIRLAHRDRLWGEWAQKPGKPCGNAALE